MRPLLPPILTKWEEAWIREQYPNLRFFPRHKLLIGQFHFDATFNNCRIIDSYYISIDLSPRDYGELPDVYEMGGRIIRASKILRKSLRDLHTYDNGLQCLIRPDKISETYRNNCFIPQFFRHLTSHFYWQSYVLKYGKEPWPGEEHGWPTK